MEKISICRYDTLLAGERKTGWITPARFDPQLLCPQGSVLAVARKLRGDRAIIEIRLE
jgi:hypothetical protein